MTAVNIGLNDIVLILPMIVLFLFSLLPITAKILNGNIEPNHFFTKVCSLVGTGVSLLMLTAINSGIKKTGFDNALVFDGLSYVGSLASLLILFFSLFMFFEHVQIKGKQVSEQLFLLMNSVVGVLILLVANDLIVVFIGLEIMSLSLYLLIALSKEEVLSKEASLKYFILGGLSSAIFLYGVSFIFGSVGSTYLTEISQVSEQLMISNNLFLVGVVLMLAGLCFKVSVFPFHMWTPDVYEGAATPVTSYMATGVKLASFVIFLKIMLSVSIGTSVEIVNIFQWLAVLTILVGNIAAIQQNNFKRMLAYSSIAHSGYIVIGLIAASLDKGSQDSILGFVLYLLIYSIMTVASFAVISLFENKENESLLISDFKGLAKSNTSVAIAMMIILFSLAGLPPALGFFGKLYLFSSAIDQGLLWPVVWALIGSVVSVYYYLRPIVYMFMDEGGSLVIKKGNGGTKMVVFVLTAAIVIFGLMSETLLKAVDSSLQYLF